MPRSSRITVTGADRPGSVIVPSWDGKGRRTTTTVATKATTRITTSRAPSPTRLRRSARRRGTGGTLTGPAERPGEPYGTREGHGMTVDELGPALLVASAVLLVAVVAVRL